MKSVDGVIRENLRLNATIHAPLQIDTDQLNEWLFYLAPEINVPVVAVDEAPCFCFVTYCLVLMPKMYQLAGVPLFEPPRLQSLVPVMESSNYYKIAIMVDHLHQLELQIHQKIFRAVLRLVAWMSQNQISQSHRDSMEQFVRESVIKPIRLEWPSGASTIPILAVAHRLGIPIDHVGSGVYQLGWASKSRLLFRSSSDQDSAIGAWLVSNKLQTAKRLIQAGLPAPQHYPVRNHGDAQSAALKIGFPVVVKPVDGERGEGVTVDVANMGMLEKAFDMASIKSQSKTVLVERQAFGVCHRLFIVGGEMLYAVRRNPMSVRGDGRHTVRQLVEKALEDDRRLVSWDRSKMVPLDEMALQSLKQAGMTPDSVPAEGKFAPLRRIESTEWGGVDDDVTDLVHPDNIGLAIQSANLFGLDIAGIDIISEDITQAWYKNGAIINEVNFAPLLGGAPISRFYLPKFFRKFLGGDGRIPVEIITNQSEAFERQKHYIALGLRCYLISGEVTCDSQGRMVNIIATGLRTRLKVLLVRADVDAVVIAQF